MFLIFSWNGWRNISFMRLVRSIQSVVQFSQYTFSFRGKSSRKWYFNARFLWIELNFSEKYWSSGEKQIEDPVWQVKQESLEQTCQRNIRWEGGRSWPKPQSVGKVLLPGSFSTWSCMSRAWENHERICVLYVIWAEVSFLTSFYYARCKHTLTVTTWFFFHQNDHFG